MTKAEFLRYLHEGDFRQLFLECFWNNPITTAPCVVATEPELYFQEAAQKKGYRIFVCRCTTLPDSAMRRMADAQLRKLYHDYLAIYVSTADPFHQLWSVPVKTVDKRQLVTIEYVQDDQAAFLLDKISALTFMLDEEPTIVDVVDRVNAAFLVNTAEVTKKFYQGFRKQHDAFVKGIQNLSAAADREWYASVMLNRLMFCYFIQKKHFLDFNENYLGDKLRETQAKKGKDKFYESFYRSFLKQLFSDGLDKPVSGRSDYFLKKYGRIPYLNGGMFSRHQIEEENRNLDIPDQVFENLFAFFDQWCWHLDNRITASGRDINPDVLGYIFEQYINDRAQMGAYYTKEDITEYIGRNCILPFLFQKVLGGTRSVASANWIWQFLRDSGDAYIFSAVRKGVDLPLPDYIEQGVSIVDATSSSSLRVRRSRWNEKAGEQYALPTEIWRETVARRQRCADIRAKISSGAITDIHDFITYNLDIRTFAEDVIRQTSDHKLVRSFYQAVREVSILDPTCGSGAFLFAALNILEPLYEACLDRMEEWHAQNANLFKEELDEIAGKFRSNRQYFIYKNIILRNLYGVDIMHEATEIARLRLFLKMVAVVDVDEYDDNLGLDPLPDIDFNIRCGNTLVGYATEQEIKDGLVNGDMFAYAELKNKIDSEMEKVSMAYDFFRREQLNLTGDHQQLVEAKQQIHQRLAVIRNLLDDQLYDRHSGKKKAQWLADTQPFHWYTEFYPIMHGRGGFDVIIGNPPYVEWSKVGRYAIRGYETLGCGNIYTAVCERSYRLLACASRFGMIVPLSCVATSRMQAFRSLWKDFDTHVSLYSADAHPSILFNGVKFRLSILLQRKGLGHVFSTHFMRWYPEYRDNLFFTVRYTVVPTELVRLGLIPKLSNEIQASVFAKLIRTGKPIGNFVLPQSANVVYAHRIVAHYVKAFDFIPFFKNERDGERKSEDYKEFPIESKSLRTALCAVLNSTTFYSWFVSYSDVYHCGRDIILDYPTNMSSLAIDKDLLSATASLIKDFARNKVRRKIPYKSTGLVTYDEFYPRKSKLIIDEIDELLAKHYGFTEEELDFIINYDIKYRMGDELNADN